MSQKECKMKKYFAILLGAVLMTACQQKFEKHWDLVLDSDAYIVAWSDESLTITVWCSDAWEASLDEGSQWVTLGKTSGKGVGSLTLHFSPNPGLSRKAGVTLASGSATQHFTLTQKAAVASPKLFFQPERVVFPKGTYVYDAVLITNLTDQMLLSEEPALDFGDAPAWVGDVVMKGGETAADPSLGLPDCKVKYLSMKVNSTAEASAELSYKFTDASLNEYSASLELVSGTEEPYLTLEHDSIEAGRNEVEKKIGINTNIPGAVGPDKLKVNLEKDFISASVVNDTLIVKVPYNDSGDERSGSVEVSYEDASGRVTSARVAVTQDLSQKSYENCTIRTADELMAWLRDKDVWQPTDHIALAADIDMAGRTWTPVDFQGTFDGQGHSILNLKVEQNGYAGLFRLVRGNALIKDLTIGSPTDDSSFTVTAADGGYAMVGPIAKIADAASLVNITNYADICVAASCTDGTKGNYAGGIVGSHFSTGEVSGCVNYGKVSFLAKPGAYLDLGGICGEIAKGGTLSSCTNNGAVLMQADKGASTNIGGVAGYLNGASTITGNVNNASVTLENNSGESFKAYIGGVIGFIGHATAASAISPVKISGCRNLEGGTVTCHGSKSGELFAGGFVGYTLNVDPAFSDCHNAADILADCELLTSSYPYYGGFAGQIKGAGTISNCSSSGNVTNKSDIPAGSLRMAGFIGGIGCAGVVVKNCNCENAIVTNKGVSGSSTKNGVGGLIGTTTGSNTRIEGCTMRNVTVTSVSGNDLKCAMIFAYVAANGVVLERNGVSGFVNSTALDESSLATSALLYYAMPSVASSLSCTETYIVK